MPEKKNIGKRVLIACEESQALTIAFRGLGVEAFSCDLIESSGGFPQWHIKGNVLDVLKEGWALMVAFPPCTHLSCSGARWFKEKKEDGRQYKAISFFMDIVNSSIPKIAVENPVGIMSTKYRKPDQIIQPYFFGDEAQKTTCLWLKGLPKLLHFPQNTLFDKKTHVHKGEFITTPSGKRLPKWYSDNKSSKVRSKTFRGVAEAMAIQWMHYV
jgi:hypothetical protein